MQNSIPPEKANPFKLAGLGFIIGMLGAIPFAFDYSLLGWFMVATGFGITSSGIAICFLRMTGIDEDRKKKDVGS